MSKKPRPWMSIFGAPVVVASGMGYLAEKIVEVASENGVPVYEDNSLSTFSRWQVRTMSKKPRPWMSILKRNRMVYRAIVEIYVYFLNFDPNDPDKSRREREAIDRRADAAR